MDRRKFLKVTGAGIAGSALSGSLMTGLAAAGEPGGPPPPGLHLFSKHLQFLDYPGMAKAAVDLGLAGLDLTVRPGGHVEPDNFERDLPLAVDAIRQAGLKCEMMASGISGTDNPRDYDLLSLARELGIKSYRLGFLRYDADVSPMEGVERYREQFAGLAEWNEKIGITGLAQNHSGPERFGAAIWDAYLVLKDLNPDYLGLQYDIRHAVTDGGLMWPTTFRLIKPYIRSIIFKDFKWGQVDGEWKLVNTPMGEGMVDWKRYFRMLKDHGLDYPVSLHCEYDSLGGANKGRRELTIPESEALALIKRDVEFVHKLWQKA
ncbi:MAG: TIM barrel protein [Lysobacterales bacterium]|jgi:sugar phosphate isomerase/epimerase